MTDAPIIRENCKLMGTGTYSKATVRRRCRKDITFYERN